MKIMKILHGFSDGDILHDIKILSTSRNHEFKVRPEKADIKHCQQNQTKNMLG